MTQDNFILIILKLKWYVKENWGSPFIAGFMLLLLAAAVSLSLSFSFLANDMATYAFYALAAGVVLQLASFLKYPKRHGEND
jgi:hypothetical protein